MPYLVFSWHLHPADLPVHKKSIVPYPDSQGLPIGIYLCLICIGAMIVMNGLQNDFMVPYRHMAVLFLCIISFLESETDHMEMGSAERYDTKETKEEVILCTFLPLDGLLCLRRSKRNPERSNHLKHGKLLEPGEYFLCRFRKYRSTGNFYRHYCFPRQNKRRIGLPALRSCMIHLMSDNLLLKRIP